MKKLLIYIAMAGATLAGRVAEERTGISGILENKGTGGRGACTRIPQYASDSSYVNLLGRTSRGIHLCLFR